MAKEQKCPPCPKGLPGWLQTFGDLMSLLLCFFVLLLSFSTMKKEDFEKAVGSLQGALGVLPGEPILSSPIKLELPIVRGDLTEARPTLKDAKSELEKQVEAEGQWIDDDMNTTHHYYQYYYYLVYLYIQLHLLCYLKQCLCWSFS